MTSAASDQPDELSYSSVDICMCYSMYVIRTNCSCGSVTNAWSFVGVS